jgi:triphosphatase
MPGRPSRVLGAPCSVAGVAGRGPAQSQTEVEWQFDALDLRPVERWLAAVPTAPEPAPSFSSSLTVQTAPAALSADPLAARRLVDAYLDTADWRIGRSGYVLRVRRRAGGAEVTLKDTSPATDGLRRRLEVTEPLPQDGVGALGDDGPVGRRLHALVGSRPLRQVLEVRTRRRPFALRRSGAQLAEVALDDTVIVVGDSTRPVRLRRVEVEVTAAAADALTPLVRRLQGDCGLQPATLSKFEAGLLASGMRIPGPPDLGATVLAVSPSVGDLAFAVLRRNLAVMLEHEPGTRLGEDPEELHDMRVATRRMRAALALFADGLPVRAQHVRAELGWLADALGAVRDLDVQLERLEEWAAEVPDADRGVLEDLGRLLHRQRDAARGRLLAALESARYERLVASFATMLRQGPSRRSAPARVPAAAVVPDLVRMRHRAVTKAAKRARRSAAADDFHALRIRCKRLRYALEFVSDLYGAQVGKYVKTLVRLQDALGLMQDARVASERLHALVLDEGAELSDMTIFVMGGVAERYRRESEELARRVPTHLGDVTGKHWQHLVDHLDARRLEATPLYGWRPASPSHAPVPPRPAPGEGPARQAALPPPPTSGTPAVPGVDQDEGRVGVNGHGPPPPG